MYNQTNITRRKYFSMYCLQHFTSEDKLNNHTELCIKEIVVLTINMLKEGINLQFFTYSRQIWASFVIYANFEAIIEKAE